MTEDSTSVDPPRRPVRLLDLMALVAAAALTLTTPAIIREITPAYWGDRPLYVIHIINLSLVWWTAILSSMALVDYRSQRNQNGIGAGHAALFAVMATLSFLGLDQLASAVLKTSFGWAGATPKYFWVLGILQTFAYPAGAAIIAAWLILWLTKTGRRPSNWLDRLGFIVGLIWIFLAPTNRLVWVLPIPWLKIIGLP